MTITVEAIYENGVLRPSTPLPLEEQEQVQLIVRRSGSMADKSFGMIGWSGDAATFDHIFKESESDLFERP